MREAKFVAYNIKSDFVTNVQSANERPPGIGPGNLVTCVTFGKTCSLPMLNMGLLWAGAGAAAVSQRAFPCVPGVLNIFSS